MKRCPKCGKTNRTFTAAGPLVWGKTSVVYNEQGLVIGPIVPVVVVKNERELSPSFTLTCPSCNHTAPHSMFIDVTICFIDGVSEGSCEVTFTIDDVELVRYVCPAHERDALDAALLIEELRGR